MSMRLMLLLYSMIATTIMGIIITGLLSAGMVTGRYILLGTVAGAVIALPVSWMIARAITRPTAH